ncbi:NAD(P)(+)--arginine ADP-ribosyltransferase 2-like isoform X2 [Oratosquilla oratoria]|uniref:NAD(P)(+)--arginine ADP-ribosyltransferase 2-like isoform X2 n=1 Tax=Oratosquilla oratoria TaxID=337810 RepID=UPI003F75B992
MEETRETRFVEIDADAIYIEDSSTFWKKSMGFWLYLHKAVSQCGLSDELCILYRGCGIKFEAAIGTKMKFQHFVSTTANRAIAEKFAEGGTLFVFQVYNALNISSLSIFPNEEEHLLTPNDGFEVVDIKQGKYKEIYLKTLSFSFIH